MNNKFTKPEIEILHFRCEVNAADTYGGYNLRSDNGYSGTLPTVDIDDIPNQY